MPRSVDIKKKAEELKRILQQYNGVPSQAENKAAYANIKYYVTKYGDQPEIKALIEEYGISFSKYGDYQSGFKEIKTILSDLGQMPSSSHDKTRYQRVKNYFRRFKDVPEVERLRYIYAFDCFPLPDTKYGPKPDADYFFDSWNERAFVSKEWKEWRDNVVFEYIEYVFEHYRELPGVETKPMVALKKKINHWNRYNVDVNKSEQTKLYDFLRRMIGLGCDETMVKQAYYSFKFIADDIQERVEKMLIENGACAIHYIAQTAMPGCVLSDSFVYYYYYVKLNDSGDDREKMPLASLYSEMKPHRVLRVHYRDYHKCDINKIRESARSHYRDWREYRPETLEEWKYYGQSEFFDDKEDFFDVTVLGGYDSSIDWATTFIEKQLIKGKPYFRHYDSPKRYLDYYLYLLENGYTLKDEDLLRSLDTEKLANDDKITNEDWSVFIKILGYLPNCICDGKGGYYLLEENKYVLLCLSKKVLTYQLNENTTSISRNAFRLVEDDIESIILNKKLSSNFSCLDRCKYLKQIIVSPQCVDNYLNVFTKFETTKFHDFYGRKIHINPIIDSNKLIYVPYTEKFIVPDYIEEIDKNAFRGSGIKQLTISGGTKEIKESLFWCDNDLEEVTILEGVERLWGNIFGNCSNLKKVTLPHSLTSLYGCFQGCSSLHTINLDYITYLGSDSFRECTSLESIRIESHLSRLDGAFRYCENLKHIEINNGFDFIEGSFEGCINLETITIRGQKKPFNYITRNLGVYNCEKLKAIYVQAEYIDLFREKFTSEYQHLLKEIN